MKRTLFRITMLILLGLTFFAIFNFSSQDGKTSSGLSRKVARKIVDIFQYTKNLREKTKSKKKNRRHISKYKKPKWKYKK